MASARRVERATGRLSTAAVARMAEELEWFRELPAETRSWVGLVAQAGIRAFVEWLRAHDEGGVTRPVFGAAPRELARLISLQQTVQLVRVTVDVVEEAVPALAAPGEEVALREAMLRFSREVAFSAAEVYATTAEERGAWHARQRALLVEALLRGDTRELLQARAGALGWGAPDQIAVMIGTAPESSSEAALDDAERTARTLGLDAIAGTQGDRLVLVFGGTRVALRRLRRLVELFGAGPVVVGPTVSDITDASASAQAALAGARVAHAWPDAPRPVDAEDLLPERALEGDRLARVALEDVYKTLTNAGQSTVDTVTAYLGCGGSVEATARALFLHPNTVRYRLRKATETCGVLITDPRGAYVVQVALTLGRLTDS